MFMTNCSVLLKLQNEEKEHYDVAVVGAGPSGATCAYFLGT